MIYLIDDDEIQNLINTKIISLINPELKVDAFTTVENALYQLNASKSKPDLIFVDINMPMITGWDFIDKFGEMNLSSAVYMLSSSINDKDVQRAKNIPLIKDFIRKPLDVDYLRQLFQAHQLI